MKLVLLICAILLSARAFKMPTGTRVARRSVLCMSSVDLNDQTEQETEFNPFQFSEDKSPAVVIPILAAALPFLVSDPVLAAASDYGIFAGRTASLAHPVTNLALFFTSLYSAYLGYNWRRLRGIGEELKELSTQMPKLSSGIAKAPLSDMVTSLSAEITSLTGNPLFMHTL
jgi:hypothetical protein